MDYKTAINNLKKTLKAQALKKCAVRREINDLRWSVPTLPEAVRDESGRKLTGKKSRKPFARPDTGPTRDRLHASYQFPDRAIARAQLIAYGLLRGKTYASMEPHSESSPWVSKVVESIHDAFEGDKTMKAEWSYARVADLLVRAPVSAEVAS